MTVHDAYLNGQDFDGDGHVLSECIHQGVSGKSRNAFSRD